MEPPEPSPTGARALLRLPPAESEGLSNCTATRWQRQVLNPDLSDSRAQLGMSSQDFSVSSNRVPGARLAACTPRWWSLKSPSASGVCPWAAGPWDLRSPGWWRLEAFSLGLCLHSGSCLGFPGVLGPSIHLLALQLLQFCGPHVSPSSPHSGGAGSTAPRGLGHQRLARFSHESWDAGGSARVPCPRD